jgi:outer membrane receptor protein involved in Fe transport
MTKLRFATRLKCSTAITGALALLAASAAAVEARAADQPAGPVSQGQAAPAQKDGETAPGEIVVTAERRSERLQNVPISIAVMTGAKLDSNTASGTSEALTGVAGVSITANTQNGSNMVEIRGVSAGDANFGGAATVGFYIDSLPFGFVRTAIAPNLDAYDLDRVEVLRGPQGTLYGASASNGVVRVLTHDPDLDQFEVKFRTSLSDTYNGGDSYRDDLAVNVPLIKDQLAARLVFGYDSLGGWISQPGYKDANSSIVQDFRGRVRYQPTDHLTLDLTIWQDSNLQNAASSAYSPYFNSEPHKDPDTATTDTYGLHLAYDFSTFSVSLASSLVQYKSDGSNDYDNGFGGGYPGLFVHSTWRSDVSSSEINLHSTTDGDWRWSAGAIYRDGTDRTFFGYGFYASPGSLFSDSTDQDTSQSYAVFGEVTRLLFDKQVEVTGGLRFFHDQVTTLDPTGVVPGIASETSQKVSPRAVLTWHPNPNLSYYASYSEGFRSGYPQLISVVQASLPAVFPAAKPDNLENYEIGAKGNIFHNTTFDAAVYYIDWQSVQQAIKVPLYPLGAGTSPTYTTGIINAQSASGAGVDLSITTQPIEGLRLTGGVDYNGLGMDSDVDSAGGVLYYKGDRLDLSPAITANANLQYSFPLFSNLRGRFEFGGNYTSKQTDRTISPGVPLYVHSGDDVTVLNTSFSIVQSGRWTWTAYINNLNNFTGVVAPSNIANLFPNWDSRMRPRTIGMQFEVHY